jgi:hypothetical protein
MKNSPGNRFNRNNVVRLFEGGEELVRRQEVYYLDHSSLPTLVWRYEEVARPIWREEKKQDKRVARGGWWVEVFALLAIGGFIAAIWRI